MNLTIDEFDMLSDFIYRKIGIRLESKKMYFLSIRINKRIKALDMQNAAEYIRHLRFLDGDESELQNLTNLLTINETYFFRDFSQLQVFAEHCIPEVVEKKLSNGDRELRVWSAACSTGDEPYTLAIIMQEMIDNIQDLNVEVLATDIDENALEKASSAVYGKRNVKDVPRSYLERYFLPPSNGTYTLSRDVKDMVRFEHLNLSEKLSIRKKRGFDFIFCRNVLIYFDDVSRKQVVDHFYTALNKGGYIFLSSTESLGRITTAFKLKRVMVGGESYLVYCKE